MTRRRASALERMTPAYSRWRRSRSVSSSSVVIPITPFIGVRTSWLTLDRNSLRARLAVSACSRASARAVCSSASCRSSSAIRGSDDWVIKLPTGMQFT